MNEHDLHQLEREIGHPIYDQNLGVSGTILDAVKHDCETCGFGPHFTVW